MEKQAEKKRAEKEHKAREIESRKELNAKLKARSFLQFWSYFILFVTSSAFCSISSERFPFVFYIFVHLHI